MTELGTAGLFYAFALGLASAAGLLVGAVGGTHAPLGHRGIASLMALGAGMLLAVFALDLVAAALDAAGAIWASLSLLAGAAAFSGANVGLAAWGARDRKRCGECVAQPRESERPGSGLAIAAGSLLDAVPEALVLGLTLRLEGAPDLALAAAFALANVPEAWSSAAGMQLAGRTKAYVFGVWGAVVLVSGLAAAAGYLLLPDGELASGLLEGAAAGALLAVVVETVVPEAFSHGSRLPGTVAALGFVGLLGLLTVLGA